MIELHVLLWCIPRLLQKDLTKIAGTFEAAQFTNFLYRTAGGDKVALRFGDADALELFYYGKTFALGIAMAEGKFVDLQGGSNIL